MKVATGLVVLAMGLLASQLALADVKAGVDAWTAGDFDRAAAEWQPLAVAGDADAQFNMGQAYKLGRGVAMDLPVALDWYRRAREQGHVRATDNYGLLLFQQGRREDAMPIIRASAERGEPRAQYIYATALFNGDLVPQDWVQAYAMMTAASQAGLSQASDSLKQMSDYIPENQRRRGLTIASGSSGAAQAPVVPSPASPPPAIMTSALVQTSPAAEQQFTASPPAASPVSSPPPAVAALVEPKASAIPEATKPANAETVPSIRPAPAGRWRVQLGAFSQRSRAEALWKTLSTRVSGLSALQPFLVESGGVTRLQAGPLASSSEATSLCATVTAAGNACLAKVM